MFFSAVFGSSRKNKRKAEDDATSIGLPIPPLLSPTRTHDDEDTSPKQQRPSTRRRLAPALDSVSPPPPKLPWIRRLSHLWPRIGSRVGSSAATAAAAAVVAAASTSAASSASQWGLTEVGDDVKQLLTRVLVETLRPRDAAMAALVCREWRATLGKHVAAVVALEPGASADTDAGDAEAALTFLVSAGKDALAPHAAKIVALLQWEFKGNEHTPRKYAVRAIKAMEEHAAPFAGDIVALLGHEVLAVREIAPFAILALDTHALPHIAAIVRKLRHPDDIIRSGACCTLTTLSDRFPECMLGHLDEIAAPLAANSDCSEGDRVTACKALYMLGPLITSGAAARLVVARLKDESMAVSLSAANALHVMKHDAAPYVDEVEALLHSADEDARYIGLIALGALGGEGGAGVHALSIAHRFQDEVDTVRCAALDAITELGTEAAALVAERIADALDDHCPDVRISALEAMAIVEEACIPHLGAVAEMLEDEEGCVVAEAVRTLVALRQHLDDSHMEFILGYLCEDEEDVREAGMHAVEGLGPEHIAPHLPYMMNLLAEQGVGTAAGESIAAAIATLGEHARPHLAYVEDMLHDDDAPSSLLAALEAFRVLKSVGGEHAEAVVRVLGNEEHKDDEEIFEAACRAVWALESAAAPHVGIIAEAFEWADEDMARELSNLISNLGDEAAPYMHDVDCRLKSPDPLRRKAALEALAAFGSVAAPVADKIVARFADADEEVRLEAVLTLSALGQDAAGPHASAFAGLLEDEYVAVRVEALSGLEKIGKHAVPHMSAIAGRLADRSTFVVDAAMEALAVLAKVAREVAREHESQEGKGKGQNEGKGEGSRKGEGGGEGDVFAVSSSVLAPYAGAIAAQLKDIRVNVRRAAMVTLKGMGEEFVLAHVGCIIENADYVAVKILMPLGVKLAPHMSSLVKRMASASPSTQHSLARLVGSVLGAMEASQAAPHVDALVVMLSHPDRRLRMMALGSLKLCALPHFGSAWFVLETPSEDSLCRMKERAVPVMKIIAKMMIPDEFPSPDGVTDRDDMMPDSIGYNLAIMALRTMKEMCKGVGAELSEPFRKDMKLADTWINSNGHLQDDTVSDSDSDL